MSRATDIHLRGRDQNATRTLRGVEGAAASLGSGLLSLKNIFFAVLGGAAIRQAFGFLRSTVDEFAEVEEVQRAFRTALELSGAELDRWLPRLSAFADEIERTTVISAEAAMEIMRVGLGLQVPADQIEHVTQAAIGLADALGISTEMALIAVNREIVEGKSSLDRYLPALRDATTHQERLAIVTDVANRGFAAAQDRINSTKGATDQLDDTIGRLRESIGEQLAPTKVRFAQLLDQTVGGALDRYGDRLWAVGMALDHMTAVGVAGVRTFAAGIVSGFTAAEVVISRFGDVATIAFDTFKLGSIAAWEGTKQVFGTWIPDLLTWFSDNWRSILIDLAMFTGTTFSNLGSNIVSVLTNLPDLVAGRVSFRDLWTPLTDGFVSTLSELPTFAERELTEVEKQLAERIRTMSGDLLDDFSITLNDRLRRLGLAGGPRGAGAGGAAGGDDRIKFDPIELAPDAKAALEDGVSIDRARRGGGTTPELQAREFRFLTRAPGVDQQLQNSRATADNTQRTAKSTQEMTGLLQQANTLLARIANTPPGIVEGGGLA